VAAESAVTDSAGDWHSHLHDEATGGTGTVSNTYPPSSVRLGDYLGLVRRRWLSILVGILLGVALTLAYLAVAPRSYTARTSVLVMGTPGDGATASGNRGTINLDTEAQLVTSTGTLSAVAATLHLSGDQAAALPEHVTVTVPPNTEILDISYVASTPVTAQQGSLAFAKAYLAQRQAAADAYLKSRDKGYQTQIDQLSAAIKPLLPLAAAQKAGSEERTRTDQQITSLNNRMATLTNQQSQIRATAVEPGRIVVQPNVPTDPSSPDLLVALAAGAMLSLLLGVGLAAIRQRSDDRIHTPEELYQRTRVPVATVLSSRQHAGQVTLVPPMSRDGRGFARLRNLVTANLDGNDRRVVLVAGIRRGVGPVAANLAASLARSGEDVVLVCADVFASTAEGLTGGAAHDGLAELLSGEASLDAVLQRPEGIDGLRVLGPGRDPNRADAVLQTSSPRKLVDELLETASFVVIEAPATSESPDAQTLAAVAAVAVLVVDAGHATAREVVDACAQLESMHTPVLGAVFAKFGRDRFPHVDVNDPSAVAEPAKDAVSTVTAPRDVVVEEDATAPEPVARSRSAASGPEVAPPRLGGRPRP
jgi:Mrp family chromosome partitioning ATPase